MLIWRLSWRGGVVRRVLMTEQGGDGGCSTKIEHRRSENDGQRWLDGLTM